MNGEKGVIETADGTHLGIIIVLDSRCSPPKYGFTVAPPKNIYRQKLGMKFGWDKTLEAIREACAELELGEPVVRSDPDDD